MKILLNFFESSKIILCALAFLFGSPVQGQSLFPDTAYIRTFGGPNMDVGRDVKPTSDGGFILTGTTSSFGSGNTALYLIKTDSMGIRQWSKAIGGIGIEWGLAVVQTFDGGYAAAGYTNSFGNGGYDMYLVKTDASGNVLWEKTYGGNDWDFGHALIQTADSGLVICGKTYSFGNGNEDAYVVKTDKNGNTLWTRTFGGTANDAAHSVVEFSSTSLSIAGETGSFGNGGKDVFYITLDQDGSSSSQKTFGSTKDDMGFGIEKTLDGGVVIMGETDSMTAGNREELLMKISADTLEWLRVFNGSGVETGAAVKQKSNGDFITCGSTTSNGLGGNALHMMMINSGGWWLSGPAFGGTGDEMGSSLCLAPNKKIAFIGSTTTATYTQGLEDVYFILLKNDSIVMNYTLSVVSFEDTLSPLSVQELPSQANVHLFPLPMVESTTLTIGNWGSLGIRSAALKLFDTMGREVLSAEITNSKYEIKRGQMNAGIYFYSVSSASGLIAGGKLVIQ